MNAYSMMDKHRMIEQVLFVLYTYSIFKKNNGMAWSAALHVGI